MENAITTTRLNDCHKTLVLAKKDKIYGLVAREFHNYNQAYYALEILRSKNIAAGIKDSGRYSRFYVVIIEN